MIKINKLLALSIIVVAMSCQNNKVDSGKAETVNLVNTNNTLTYNIIKTESFLNWTASHLGGIDAREGKIYCKEATVLVNNERVTNINTLIDMNSLTVDNLALDDAQELGEHLKSSDFFNIKKYPFSEFNLTNIEEIVGEYNSKITGNLTILDISKSITFKGNINILEKEVSLESEYFVIDRSDWGLTYHAEGAEGVPLNYLISDNLGFEINILVKKQITK